MFRIGCLVRLVLLTLVSFIYLEKYKTAPNFITPHKATITVGSVAEAISITEIFLGIFINLLLYWKVNWRSSVPSVTLTERPVIDLILQPVPGIS